MVNAGDVIAFAGDWHGDTNWASGRVMALAHRGVKTIIHVGDFGIWPGPSGKKFLNGVEKTCNRFGMTILVTPGNHEDWDRLNAKKTEDRGDGWGHVQWLTDHIGVLPRGYRVNLETTTGLTRSLVSLGGAPSVDRERRTEGRDWWAAEAITDADVAATVAGGHADIMVAHDSPGAPYHVPEVEKILASNPFGFSVEGLMYAAEGMVRMTTAYEGVAPRLFFHGHYHVVGEKRVHVGSRDSLVVSLDKQHTSGNVVALDLNTLEIVR